MLIEGKKTTDGTVGALAMDADNKLLISGVTIDGDVTIGASVEVSNDVGNPIPVTVAQLPASLGAKAAANSLPVTLSTDGAFSTAFGAKDDASASTDTGTFSHISLLKRLVSKIPGLGATTASASLPVTIASDQANVLVSSSSVLVVGLVNGGAFTRPADTTSYAAKDVISNSTSSPYVITFAGMGRVNGGSGTIVKARLMTSQKTCTAQLRLHLFHTAPTATNDNSPYLMLYSNAANRVGMIDFPALNTEDPTNSTAAGSMRPSSDGSYGPPNLWYKCAVADTALYGVLETLSAFTPDSGQTFYIELGAEIN